MLSPYDCHLPPDDNSDPVPGASPVVGDGAKGAASDEDAGEAVASLTAYLWPGVVRVQAWCYSQG